MKKNILIISVLVFFTAISCKKYEDNPMIVLSSKTKRISRTWSIKEYLFPNGQVVSPGAEEGEITFKNDGTVTCTYPDNSVISGKWEFENNKKQLSWSNEYITDIDTVVIFDDSYILKLTKKEFWLQEENDGIITKLIAKE